MNFIHENCLIIKFHYQVHVILILNKEKKGLTDYNLHITHHIDRGSLIFNFTC